MCGIVGFVYPHSERSEEIVRSMTDRLVHRGPDAEGYWLEPGAGLALGHRRLSILDLSQVGNQPMRSACGRYVIAFNGEIYNHSDLRKQLESALGAESLRWRGHSDTEVMLAAVRAWGFVRALRSFVGMFALALWDGHERILYLARDRIGEKPLYYGSLDGAFVFGSELKALAAWPHRQLEIDREAVGELLQFGYVPAPRSIYRGIRKLEPATFLSVRASRDGRFQHGVPEKYWSLDAPELADTGRDHSTIGDDARIEELHFLLKDAVRQQMVADVPLGAFLSGGIDSSTIVALMQAQSTRAVRTFTIGFHEQSHNEAQYAREVARHLGTDHTELYVTADDALKVIPRLPTIYDEPFADSSQIPTFLLSQLTRQHVTVSLSGDGGDELFGGYPRYQVGERLWSRIGRLPGWSRRLAAASVTAISPRSWDRILSGVLPSSARETITGHRAHRMAALLSSESFRDMYVRLVSQWLPQDNVVAQARSITRSKEGDERTGDARSPLARMRRFDLDHYLPDDILVKVDRASMSVSLESRAPLLDHRVVEFVWRLPDQVLVRDGVGKWILRQILNRHVPQHLFDRPKAGFGIPVAQWLRSELREWASQLLEERKLVDQGFLNPEPVQRAWSEHLSGAFDRQAYLWNVLMFQAWLEAQPQPAMQRAAPATRRAAQR